VKSLRLITVLAASAVVLPASSAFAQRQQPTPEQRIDRLERQVNEVQRRVFPKGKPADTAGFADDPAATQSSVMSLDQRLDALERQMADMLRQTEENGNRLRSLEAGIGQLKNDEEQRIQALEQRMNQAIDRALGKY
jgi:TolA-binding protein